ncbi:MAG: amidohydrolase family protein [Verrucomicrobia bacterium]|nr:amidohydrolase family protein [Verrucomicrobiota bacterium]
MDASDSLSVGAKNRRHFVIINSLWFSAGLWFAEVAVRGGTSPPTVAFANVRVFDGSRVLEGRSVIVRDGKIATVARQAKIPQNADVTGGTGRTLLPGFIDAHVHLAADPNLKRPLIFGVTTVLDMFSPPSRVAELKKQVNGPEGAQLVDFRSAMIGVTAPGGHGTQFGIPIPTLSDACHAQEFVDARIAEGSDYIKIICEDGKEIPRPIPTLDRDTLRAVVDAAHKRKKLAVVHVHRLEWAREAVAAGADGLVHVWCDELPTPEFYGWVARKRAFVVPTLNINQVLDGIAGGKPLTTNAQFVAFLSKEDIDHLSKFISSTNPARKVHYEVARQAVQGLHHAGVSILAGTDAPNPGTLQGVSLHREVELLVQAGLSPVEALAAATSVPAQKFRLRDRGRIARGLRADLLLVEGDPTKDILATRNIVGVWKAGQHVDRAGYRRTIQEASKY